jgi:hypothetical protein
MDEGDKMSDVWMKKSSDGWMDGKNVSWMTLGYTLFVHLVINKL